MVLEEVTPDKGTPNKYSYTPKAEKDSKFAEDSHRQKQQAMGR
jgi:hypothetical protein